MVAGYLVVCGDSHYVTDSPIDAVFELGWRFAEGRQPIVFRLTQPASSLAMMVHKLSTDDLYATARRSLVDLRSGQPDIRGEGQ